MKYFEPRTAKIQAQIDKGNAVCVRRLRKEFNVDGKHLVQVNDVNLTMVKDEVFVLLGHNG